jgi:TRAP-type C4-dicarboxylate transport system permease small subunit
MPTTPPAVTEPAALALDSPAATPPPPAVVRLLAAWHRGECAIGVAAIAFMASVLLVDVAGREALGPLLKALGFTPGPTGIFGAPKLALYALALATYAGVGVATARGTHLVPRVAFRAIPARWGRAVDRLADLFTGAFLFGVAAYGIAMVRGSMSMGLLAPMLQWPVWPFQLALPLGFASAAARYLLFAAWPALRAPAANAA